MRTVSRLDQTDHREDLKLRPDKTGHIWRVMTHLIKPSYFCSVKSAMPWYQEKIAFYKSSKYRKHHGKPSLISIRPRWRKERRFFHVWPALMDGLNNATDWACRTNDEGKSDGKVSRQDNQPYSRPTLCAGAKRLAITSNALQCRRTYRRERNDTNPAFM